MNDLMKTFVRGPWTHAKRLATDDHYRTLAILITRYGRVKACHPRIVTLHNWKIEVSDMPSFLSTYYYVFVRKTYSFQSTRQDPLIVDCGANIGLTILFYKSIYPDATIIAYEADPNIFATLKRNISRNAIAGVTLINAAVGSSDGRVFFTPDGADSGRVVRPGDDVARQIEVESVRLKSQLDRQFVDMLKIDIEGAETDVLTDCAEALVRVGSLCMEFHSFPNTPQRLGSLLSLLEVAGFRVVIEALNDETLPLGLRPKRLAGGMDMQLHIFGYRSSGRD